MSSIDNSISRLVYQIKAALMTNVVTHPALLHRYRLFTFQIRFTQLWLGHLLHENNIYLNEQLVFCKGSFAPVTVYIY